jgi:hypothetical protein
MEEQINLELVKLQEELNLLDSAVKQIEKAGAISTSVVEAVKGVQEQYGKYLQRIAGKFDEYLEKSYSNSNTNLLGVTDSHQKQITEVQKLLDSYVELAEATSRLPEEINKVDFPVRLDRIDAMVNDINSGILNTQKMIDNSEKRMRSELQKISEFDKKLKNQNGQLAFLKIMLIISVLLTVGLIAMQFLPQFR